MESKKQELSTQARPVSILAKSTDVEEPLSYKEWYSSRIGILPGQEYNLYNNYLTDWYNTKKTEKKTSYTTQVKLNYLALLKQLQIFFSSKEKEKWYNFINFSDEKEILIAIPFFAKKLKEISLHYIELRNKVKNTKLQYNLGGTNLNYILELKNFLLDNFSKHENNSFRIPSYIYQSIPELSSVKNELVIQVEEIYDDHTYLDQSPTLPVSAYYNLNDPTTSGFLQTKNLVLSASEWLYSNTVTFSGDSFDPEVSLALANEYITKYIGENRFLSNIQSLSVNTETYNFNFDGGDNFFIWPAGAYKSNVISNKRYIPVALTGLNLENSGTAGTTIESSDTIFVKTIKGVQGAWLRNQVQNSFPVTMEAYLDVGKKTNFMFPYPGFGLSGDNTDWTGPSFVYNSDFYFLDDQYKKDIEREYWSRTTELTTVDSLKINNTTLVSARAYPNQVYELSDKIHVWEIPPLYTETAYSGDTQEAWLYKFNQTNIPIGPRGNSVIVWPYERLNTSEEFPKYYPENTFVCNPVQLSNIRTPFSVAGTNIDESDVIYKLRNYQDDIEDAIECAWLSGNQIGFISSGVYTVEHPSLMVDVTTGELARFVWLGNNLTDTNDVFKTVSHQPDCPYHIRNLDFTDHESCTCRSVLFTPFGHPGTTYFENRGYADFILQETDLTLPTSIDFASWKDSVLNNYAASPHFMWYRTSNKIGFGSGRWVTGNGSIPRLERGKRYAYYRAAVKANETVLPNYVSRYDYNTFSNNKHVWVRGVKDEDGNWINDRTKSQMVLNQDDILLYKRAETTHYNLSSTIFVKSPFAENKNNIWATFDYLSIADPDDQLSLLQQTTYINYPNVNYVDRATATATIPGLPEVSIDKILEIKQWTLKDPNNVITVYNTPGFSFTPLIPGEYHITVTAITGTNSSFSFNSAGTMVYTPGVTGIYTYTNIPPVSALTPLQPVLSLTSVPCPVPGFVLNTFLYGWDYGTYSQRTVTTPGARPFWAKGVTPKDLLNKYKGNIGWGTPTRFFDKHNPITQPQFSDIVLYAGQYIEYERKHPQAIFWKQPLTINQPVEIKQWCAINFELTSPSTLSSTLANFPLNIDLISIPTSAVSPIFITNIVDNEPVEVTYNAISPFTWSLTVTAQIFDTTVTPSSAFLEYEAARPWNQLANRFNPTVPHVPTLENIYTQKNTGGYFLPNSLGFSLYNAKDYTYSLSPTSAALSSLFEDVTKHYAGRGVTKLDNPSPYTNLLEDATWLKDSFLAGILAGNVNRNVIKKYQKFVPYQPTNETTPTKQPGLVTPKSRLSPWGGLEDKVWTDTLNKPSSFVGEYNTNIWADKQILKNTTERIYNWTTDIYGNQYALYKDIKHVDFYEQKTVPGTLWVRKNSQKVEPAYIALSGVFDSYKGLPLYNELTGTGILNIEVFFDTLYIETSSAVLFEKLNYDYNEDIIYSFVDSSHVVSLPLPVQLTLQREFNGTIMTGVSTAKVGETWFYPEQKIVLLSICELLSSNIVPTLYELDIAKETFTKVFPV